VSAPPGFTWRDGERTIRFGPGVVAEAVDLLGGPGYTLLTTERAAKMAPHVVYAAGAVHQVPHGLVEEVAGDLLGTVTGDRLAAFGGGRVVDVAKSLAAAHTAAGHPTRAMAIPTTLSGAEMSSGHRVARGAVSDLRVRCAVVVSDPALSASQPVPALAASAANALGHAAEAPCTLRANPVSTLAAHEAARGIVAAFARRDREPDRAALGLAALLAGYAIDSAGLGLHHVLAQTLVRAAGAAHSQANAVLLPHTLAALAWRFPVQAAALEETLGEDPTAAAARLAALAQAQRLRELGIVAHALPRCADAAAERAELDATPPRADRAEVLAIYESAF
jgi:alcohol dehydrogenase class IV